MTLPEPNTHLRRVNVAGPSHPSSPSRQPRPIWRSRSNEMEPQLLSLALSSPRAAQSAALLRASHTSATLGRPATGAVSRLDLNAYMSSRSRRECAVSTTGCRSAVEPAALASAALKMSPSRELSGRRASAKSAPPICVASLKLNSSGTRRRSSYASHAPQPLHFCRARPRLQGLRLCCEHRAGDGRRAWPLGGLRGRQRRKLETPVFSQRQRRAVGVMASLLQGRQHVDAELGLCIEHRPGHKQRSVDRTAEIADEECRCRTSAASRAAEQLVEAAAHVIVLIERTMPLLQGECLLHTLR
eukprot:scaffold1151_cov126-Isochrysis_galbana.AAC.2